MDAAVRAKPALEIAEERVRARRGVSVRPEIDRGGHDAVHVEAGVETEGRGKAASEKRGAGREDHRDRDLRDHEGRTGPAARQPRR